MHGKFSDFVVFEMLFDVTEGNAWSVSVSLSRDGSLPFLGRTQSLRQGAFPLELLRNGLTRSIIVSKQWGTSAASQGHAKVTGGGRCGQRPRRILTKRELVACHDPFASHRRHFYWPWLTWSHIVMKTRARPCLELVWFWSVQFTKFKH